MDAVSDALGLYTSLIRPLYVTVPVGRNTTVEEVPTIRRNEANVSWKALMIHVASP